MWPGKDRGGPNKIGTAALPPDQMHLAQTGSQHPSKYFRVSCTFRQRVTGVQARSTIM